MWRMVTMYDDEAQNYNNFSSFSPSRSLSERSPQLSAPPMAILNRLFCRCSMMTVEKISKWAHCSHSRTGSSKTVLAVHFFLYTIHIQSPSENIKWKLIFRFAELSHYSPNSKPFIRHYHDCSTKCERVQKVILHITRKSSIVNFVLCFANSAKCEFHPVDCNSDCNWLLQSPSLAMITSFFET